MNLNEFPSSPSEGDTYLVGNVTYKYTKGVWDVVSRVKSNIRALVERQCAEAGLVLVAGSFEEGGAVSASDEVLWCMTDAKVYGWGTNEAKTVAAGATPATSGGIGDGAWVDRTDVTLRSDINVITRRFNTFHEMVVDTKISIGDVVETMGRFSLGDRGGAKYYAVPNATYTADGGKYIQSTGSSVQLVLIQEPYMDAVVFGVVGDGVVDDTLAVRSALTRGRGITWFNNLTPLITGHIKATNGLTMKQNAKFIWGGPNSIALEFVNDNTFYGDMLRFDGGGLPCYGVVLHCDNSSFGTISVENIQAPLSSGVVVAVFTDGNENKIQKVIVKNCINTGNGNTSMPQAYAYEANASENHTDAVIVKDSACAVASQQTSYNNVIDTVICERCSDNGLYASGRLLINRFDYTGNEEPIVASGPGELYISQAVVRGSCNSVLGYGNAGLVKIGELVIQRDSSGGSPTQIIAARADNVSSGTIDIGSITGIIEPVKIFAIDKGAIYNITIGYMDIIVRYKASIMGTAYPLLFCDMKACSSFNLGKMKIDLYDVDDALTEGMIFQWRSPTSVQRASYVQEFAFIGYGSDFNTTNTNIIFRGDGFRIADVSIGKAVWQTNIGPYIRESQYNGRITTRSGVAAVPTSGYWNAGEDYELIFATAAPFNARCIVSGTPGTWVSY